MPFQFTFDLKLAGQEWSNGWSRGYLKRKMFNQVSPFYFLKKGSNSFQFKLEQYCSDIRFGWSTLLHLSPYVVGMDQSGKKFFCVPGLTTSTPPVQVTLHYCASWVETDTRVLHLWCSLSSASSLWSCDSETQPRGPAASRFTFQGLLWLPRPQTESHLTPADTEGGRSHQKKTSSAIIIWTTIEHK